MKTLSKNKLFPLLEVTVNTKLDKNISDERKTILQPLCDYIQEKVLGNEAIRITFICTHNSRRSHLAQIWAQTLAHYFNIRNIVCYSSGTESSALYPKVAEIIKKSGFKIDKIAEGDNPIYRIKYAENELPIIGFSKTIVDDFNPKSEFAAVMTCSQADAACPFVPGAEKRIPITYEDPKVYDGTLNQTHNYQKRSLQIASEMYYVFSQINS